MQLAPSVFYGALDFAFVPALVTNGGLGVMPIRTAVSPLVSQFLFAGVAQVVINLALLLIAGRYVERPLGAAGVLVLFVLGAYSAALARVVLTPGSLSPTLGAQAGLFALVGAYLMLYGLPSAITVARGQGRAVQIAAVAAIWCAIQLAFMALSGGFDLSRGIVEPIGGLIAGVALGKPILAWRYRKA